MTNETETEFDQPEQYLTTDRFFGNLILPELPPFLVSNSLYSKIRPNDETSFKYYRQRYLPYFEFSRYCKKYDEQEANEKLNVANITNYQVIEIGIDDKRVCGYKCALTK